MKSKMGAVRASWEVLEYGKAWVRTGGYRSTGQVFPTVLVSRETFNVGRKLADAAAKLYRLTEGWNWGERGKNAEEARARVVDCLSWIDDSAVARGGAGWRSWLEFDEGDYQIMIRLWEAASDLALEILFLDREGVSGDDKVPV